MPIVRNYDSLRTISRGGVRLSAGTHTIRIAFDTAQPTGGFADDAVVRDSRVGLTEIPGIGFEGKHAFYEVLRRLHE